MPWNLKQEPDDEYYYPIADCTTCGAKDVPFNTVWLLDGSNYRQLTYCLNCHDGEPRNIKGYISLIDLEDSEWDTEL